MRITIKVGTLMVGLMVGRDLDGFVTDAFLCMRVVRIEPCNGQGDDPMILVTGATGAGNAGMTEFHNQTTTPKLTLPLAGQPSEPVIERYRIA